MFWIIENSIYERLRRFRTAIKTSPREIRSFVSWWFLRRHPTYTNLSRIRDLRDCADVGTLAHWHSEQCQGQACLPTHDETLYWCRTQQLLALQSALPMCDNSWHVVRAWLGRITQPPPGIYRAVSVRAHQSALQYRESYVSSCSDNHVFTFEHLLSNTK